MVTLTYKTREELEKEKVIEKKRSIVHKLIPEHLGHFVGSFNGVLGTDVYAKSFLLKNIFSIDVSTEKISLKNRKYHNKVLKFAHGLERDGFENIKIKADYFSN